MTATTCAAFVAIAVVAAAADRSRSPSSADLEAALAVRHGLDATTAACASTALDAAPDGVRRGVLREADALGFSESAFVAAAPQVHEAIERCVADRVPAALTSLAPPVAECLGATLAPQGPSVLRDLAALVTDADPTGPLAACVRVALADAVAAGGTDPERAACAAAEVVEDLGAVDAAGYLSGVTPPDGTRDRLSAALARC